MADEEDDELTKDHLKFLAQGVAVSLVSKISSLILISS